MDHVGLDIPPPRKMPLMSEMVQKLCFICRTFVRLKRGVYGQPWWVGKFPPRHLYLGKLAPEYVSSVHRSKFGNVCSDAHFKIIVWIPSLNEFISSGLLHLAKDTPLGWVWGLRYTIKLAKLS